MRWRPRTTDHSSEAFAERMLSDRERYAKPIILTGAKVE